MAGSNNNIPDIITIDTAKLSETAVLHQTPHADKFYKISFEKYKKKLCEINQIDKSGHLGKILNWFKDVGLSTNKDEIPSNCDTIIQNIGNYSPLFDGIDSEDIEIKEFKISSDRRIFYYIDDSDKTLYCLLIKNSHLEY